MAVRLDPFLNPNATEFIPSSSGVASFDLIAALDLEEEEEDADSDLAVVGVLSAIRLAGYDTFEPAQLYEPIAGPSRDDPTLCGKCYASAKEAKFLEKRLNLDAATRLLAIVEEFPWHAGSAYTVGTQTAIFSAIRTWLQMAYRSRYHTPSTLFTAIFDIARAVQLCRGFNEAQKFEARNVVGLTAQEENMTSVWRLWPWRAIKCRDDYDLNLLKIFAKIHTIALTKPALPFNHAIPFAYADGFRRATSNELTMKDAAIMELTSASIMAKRAFYLECGDIITFKDFELGIIEDWFRIIEDFKTDRLLHGPAAAAMQPWQLQPSAFEHHSSAIPRQELFPFHGTRGPESILAELNVIPARPSSMSNKPPNPPKPPHLSDGFLPPPPKQEKSRLADLPTWLPESCSNLPEGNGPRADIGTHRRKSVTEQTDHVHDGHTSSSSDISAQNDVAEHGIEGENSGQSALLTPRRCTNLRGANLDWWHERPLFGNVSSKVQSLQHKPLANSWKRKPWGALPSDPPSATRRGWGFMPLLRPDVANDPRTANTPLDGIDDWEAANHADKTPKEADTKGAACGDINQQPQQGENKKSWVEMKKRSEDLMLEFAGKEADEHPKHPKHPKHPDHIVRRRK